MFSRRGNQAAKRRAKQRDAEERVSLLTSKGKATTPSKRKSKLIHRVLPETWNLTRLMRYLSMTAVSAMVTFFILGKEAKVVHWEEYHHMLEPQAKVAQRCYVREFSLIEWLGGVLGR